MTDYQRFCLWMTIGLPVVWVIVMGEIVRDGWWQLREWPVRRSHDARTD